MGRLQIWVILKHINESIKPISLKCEKRQNFVNILLGFVCFNEKLCVKLYVKIIFHILKCLAALEKMSKKRK